MTSPPLYIAYQVLNSARILIKFIPNNTFHLKFSRFFLLLLFLINPTAFGASLRFNPQHDTDTNNSRKRQKSSALHCENLFPFPFFSPSPHTQTHAGERTENASNLFRFTFYWKGSAAIIKNAKFFSSCFRESFFLSFAFTIRHPEGSQSSFISIVVVVIELEIYSSRDNG